tara:strand:- start:8302 stop:9981 length:1680 start_codon:yes stop_codon:yes gene_type:complete
VYDHHITLEGEQLRPGVWFHGSKRDGENGETSLNEWLCGPLHVDAVTRSDTWEADYGLLLRFRNVDERWLKWAMPSELLAGRPEAVLAILLSMGLKIAHRNRARVVGYIADQEPRGRITAATSTGWHGPELFITPNGSIGKGDAIYQTDSTADGDYSTAGTLEGWRGGIGTMLPRNPLLQLGIGTALAGPLLRPLGIHAGGGFHLLWDSSNGKTTIVQCASSVWGHGSHFTLKWNATANGLEGIAALRNDCLLALDELGQADPRYVGDVVYSVADGIGKQRAGRSSAARRVRRWQVMMLSSGEITLETKMSEAGKRIRAGQDVRLVTVSAGRDFGAWDNLHNHQTGASLSDSLKQISTTHYGHMGPAFIRALIDRGELGSLPARLKAILDLFTAKSGQAARVAERFAIVALALELAAEFQLLPLPDGEATASMIALFNDWQAERGEGPNEDSQIVKAVADFLDRHGGSRFQQLAAETDVVRDRAGYWRSTPSGRVYLFTGSGLREATEGFDTARAVRALESVGAIVQRDKGRAQASIRFPWGGTKKLYVIDPARLEGGS